MDYTNYNAEDLAADSAFRQWVMQPNPATDQFWIGLLQENPQLVAIVVRAIHLLQQLSRATDPGALSVADADQLEAIWQHLRSRIEQETTEPIPVGRIIRHTPSWQRWAVAAGVALVLSAGWWFTQTDTTAPIAGQLSPTASMDQASQHEAVNTTAHPVTITLSDGSSVQLQPGSRLRYAKSFAANRREVDLQGEAFFNVTKNPARPFLVFAGGTVTKVVGTSFHVQAYDQDKTVRVIVRTGRVSVFARRNFDRMDQAATSQVAGVVLTPNQRATFERTTEQLAKDLIEQPVPVSSVTQPLSFDDKPVSDVLAILEKQYGLDIVFDAQLLSQCPITTTLSANEGLYQRLDRICRAIGASYEVVDGQLIITSTGCTS
ncbi:anti-FecI sigma factor, FecR [Fibrella aestuarina BUZ 2]|uniref:Anti-FecI sigma factor, FecR n=1 Tax=Fibrella aestuarina BUZ 2 TaxID=1166018 RepID=I0K6C8_9BACT|nr:FecR family protein [Fibrella aestuarina]CCG99681.1 anti-FecI sigma factor, FecR [Fibrella aestuarina BUZ 2]